MGATAEPNSAGLRVQGTGRIRGIRADLRDVSELTPVLCALAAIADSPSEFTGIGHLRLHESDRLAALAREIGALGGQVTELPDGLHVQPRPLRPGAEPFDSYDDHRLVMARRGARARRSRPAGAQRATVGKTFPGFTGLWRQMLERPQLSPVRGHERLDEDDIRIRPGRGSRPRTRRRPAHEDAADAFVTGVDRGRYRCWTGDRVVTAMKARELGRDGVVVGDHVRLAGDVTGRARHPGPRRPGTAAHVRAAPVRRGRRPGRADHRGERGSARDRHRAGRSAATAAADRPVPGRRVRRPASSRCCA